jgi:hypothetical protein
MKMQRKEFNQYLLKLNHSSNVLKNLYWTSDGFKFNFNQIPYPNVKQSGDFGFIWFSN